MQLDNGRNSTMIQHLHVIGAQRFDSKRVIEVDRVKGEKDVARAKRLFSVVGVAQAEDGTPSRKAAFSSWGCRRSTRMHITAHESLSRRGFGHRSGQTGEISDKIRAEPDES